ncbi:MAG: TIGR02281 family clan AA aspartic protease [Bradyrhizobiaceae bacterium]|nr:TIGR02281 family clan AA aspartic protease [Hyphomicrobiales bacterium]MBV9427648.1 TIGR02281 family clan AA aspartic protease [Bradyrhizobiaceae bacterium]
MSQRALWSLLVAIAVAIVLLIVRHDEGTIAGLAEQDFGSLAYKLALLVAVGSVVLVMFRHRLAQAVTAALLWVVIGLALVFAYTYRVELHELSDRVLGEFIPGRPVSHGRTVEIARGHAGEFQVATQVNGTRVPMVLDTGASAVVLTQDAAKAAGLPLEMLAYTVNIETANGRARAAAVTLDRLGVGTIVEHAVPALIAQPGQLKTSLLGMSFLNRLESYSVTSDRVVLRARGG